jgi:hypothetical protein
MNVLHLLSIRVRTHIQHLHYRLMQTTCFLLMLLQRRGETLEMCITGTPYHQHYIASRIISARKNPTQVIDDE